MKRAWLLVLVAGCGGLKSGVSPDASENVDGTISPDAPVFCTTSISLLPMIPIKGVPQTLVGNSANLPASVFPNPQWVLKHNNVDVPFTLSPDGMNAIFTPTDVGEYDATFSIAQPSDCADTYLMFTVAPPGANQVAWRVRIVPPPDSGAPPQEELVTITGGTDNTQPAFSFDPGVAVASTVTDPSAAPVAAYLRFTPSGQPDEAVEAFSSSSGDFSTRVQGPAAEDVLIVPTSPTQAPMRVSGWHPLVPALALATADTITGTVYAPSGQPLAGARVALAIAGVPTTIAVTDAGGNFSALGHAGGAVDVTVVPPDASGLPRLVALGTTLDPSLPIAIHYAASVATVDLAGVPVTSAGNAAPGALVTFTGSIASAGSIAAGTKTAAASGVVSAVAHADGGGLLASVKVAKAPLTAIVEPVPAVDAIVAVDTSAGAPASINAPAQVAIHGVIDDPSGAPRAGVRVRLTPILALAQGTLLVPAAITDAAGAFSIQAAPGGHYALAAVDLAQAYSRIDVPDVSGGDLGTLPLGAAIALVQQVKGGSSSAVAGAAITLLCATCNGVDATRPRAEAVTDATGMFRLAVPDPGIGGP